MIHRPLLLTKKKRQCGAPCREKHTARLKAKIIHKRTPGVSQYGLAEKNGINQSLVSKWLKNKDTIIPDSVIANRKFLIKNRLLKKYNELLCALLVKFREAGGKVSFNWLWIKARVIYRNQVNDETAVVIMSL